ncbi:MAG: glycosyltransferase [Bacteroidales bacterium]
MNQTSNYDLTILVPLYNEEENVIRLEKSLTEYLTHALLNSCVLFINDGSDDGSLEKIRQICIANKDFYYISFDHNCGLSSALKSGFDLVESPYTGYIDADLQTSPEDFNRLIPYLKEYALVTGIRTNRKDNVIKKVSSKLANSFRRYMTHDGIEDTGCPLKIIATPNARKLPFFKGMHRFIPALIRLQGVDVKEVPVSHFPRMAGVAKYNLRNRLIGPFIDCFAYKWMEKRYIRYHINEQKV